MQLNDLVAVAFGVALIALGLYQWNHPMWSQRLILRWVGHMDSGLARQSRLEDADLLLANPDEWARRHPRSAGWNRILGGGGAMLVGGLILAVGVVGLALERIR